MDVISVWCEGAKPTTKPFLYSISNVILDIPSVKQGTIEALGRTDKNVFGPIHATLSNGQLRSLVE